MQQNKQIKGMKLTKYLKSKSSKRSNSESEKIIRKIIQFIVNKSSKKSTGNAKIAKYFENSRKNSKFKAVDVSNLAKPESKNKNSTSKKYSPNPSELRRKTNSVEPPSQDMRMVSSPGQGQYHRHNKSVNQPKSGNAGTGKYKAKHYVMSQGNTELKQTLDKVKRKGKALRSLHRSDVNSLEHDDSSEYDMARDWEPPMISKEMNIPSELYASYKRQKLTSSALDTPISNFSKETSPQFFGQKNSKVRTSSLVGNSQRPNTSKDKKRASSSNAAQHRLYMVNSSNNSTNSHDISAQIDNYQAQKYYDIYNQKHNKSPHVNASKGYNPSMKAGHMYNKNSAGLKIIEEATNNSKKQMMFKPASEMTGQNAENHKSNERIKITNKKGKSKELEIECGNPQDFIESGKNEYKGKVKDYEPLKQHRKTKSGNKEAYSQLNNYSDLANVEGKKTSNLLEYKMSSINENIGLNRKTESKHENYLDKLEESSVNEKGEQILHSDLLSYIEPELFSTISQKRFDALSPRSKEINSTIRIVKKSFREYKEPPETTTDFYKIGRNYYFLFNFIFILLYIYLHLIFSHYFF